MQTDRWVHCSCSCSCTCSISAYSRGTNAAPAPAPALPSVPYGARQLNTGCAWLQVLIQHQSGTSGAELERELFILRKLIEQEKVKRMSAQTADAESVQEAEEGADPADFYVCSLSATSIVYKVRAGQVDSGLTMHLWPNQHVQPPHQSCGVRLSTQGVG